MSINYFWIYLHSRELEIWWYTYKKKVILLRITVFKPTSVFKPFFLVLDRDVFSLSACCEMSHNTTWPFRHPPAIMFGSVGLNLKQYMSSGASSKSWNIKKKNINEHSKIKKHRSGNWHSMTKCKSVLFLETFLKWEMYTHVLIFFYRRIFRKQGDQSQ